MKRYTISNKWYDIIDYQNIINTNYEKEYLVDDNFNSNDDVDINNINFSLDNQKILVEINKILNIKNLCDYNSLDLLKQQDLFASYISKSIIQNNIKNFDFLIRSLNWLKYFKIFII